MLWTIIPAKPFRLAKRRLAGTLTDEERNLLARTLLRRTLAVVRMAVGDQPVVVVSPTDEVSSVVGANGADRLMLSSQKGLNSQIAEVAAQIPDHCTLLVLHADLPLLAPSEVSALLATPGGVVIAPDRADKGSNALLQQRAPRFFSFGVDSFARHRRSAFAAGTEAVAFRAPGVSFDLDDERDWFHLRRVSGLADAPPAAIIERLGNYPDNG